jgi:hypothetical protein
MWLDFENVPIEIQDISLCILKMAFISHPIRLTSAQLFHGDDWHPAIHPYCRQKRAGTSR